MAKRLTFMKESSLDSLLGRLPERFFNVVLDREKPVCGLDEYAASLDDWVRSEMGLPARHGVRYDGMTLAIMEAIEVARIADWFRYAMTGTPQSIDIGERVFGYGRLLDDDPAERHRVAMGWPRSE